MNDSEEFLFLLLSSMQEELNQNVKDPKNENREKIIESKWVSYRVKNASFIDSIFTGFNQSKITCKNCTRSFYSYEPFMDLSVPIPKNEKSIDKCLQIFFDEESINCNYHCENCKINTNVSLIYNI
jgi:ubiquitin C-terminal hydrolase